MAGLPLFASTRPGDAVRASLAVSCLPVGHTHAMLFLLVRPSIGNTGTGVCTHAHGRELSELIREFPKQAVREKKARFAAGVDRSAFAPNPYRFRYESLDK